MRQKHKRDEGWGAPGRRPAEPRHAGGTEDRAAVALGQELWAVTLAAQASTSEGLEWEAEMLRQQQGWGRQPPHTPVGTEQRAQSKALRLLWQQLPSSSELGRRPRAQEERPQEGAVQDGWGATGKQRGQSPPTHCVALASLALGSSCEMGLRAEPRWVLCHPGRTVTPGGEWGAGTFWGCAHLHTCSAWLPTLPVDRGQDRRGREWGAQAWHCPAPCPPSLQAVVGAPEKGPQLGHRPPSKVAAVERGELPAGSAPSQAAAGE